MPINGPLLLIPGSHKQGVFEAGHDKLTTSYPLWTLDKDTVTRLCRDAESAHGQGIVAPTGKPGSVLMFHGNLVHASPPNITPYPRKIVYVTFCACSNHITRFTREAWIAHRDFTPIQPVADDVLLDTPAPIASRRSDCSPCSLPSIGKEIPRRYYIGVTFLSFACCSARVILFIRSSSLRLAIAALSSFMQRRDGCRTGRRMHVQALFHAPARAIATRCGSRSLNSTSRTS